MGAIGVNDVTKVLETCLKIESLAAEIYAYFANVYAGRPEIAALWRKTSSEEELHANQFKLAMKMRSQIVKSVNFDLHTALQLLTDLESYFNQVKASVPTIQAALESAIIFENNLAEFHMRSVAVFHDESYTQLFKAMMSADQDHVSALQEALDAVRQK